MKIKINRDFSGHKVGDVIDVSSTNGVPNEIFWRRRLRDASIDDCCEAVKETVSLTNKTTKEDN